MAEQVRLALLDGEAGLRSALLRYELLERLARSARSHDVIVFAFGVAPYELRLILDGSAVDIRSVLRGVKSGTSRAARRIDVVIEWGPTERQVIAPGGLDESVAWAHSAPSLAGVPKPLASPWSSHRDLMGYRVAKFYDATVLAGRVDKTVVHRLARGGPLPRRPAPKQARPEGLNTLLRLAGATLGVLPADRRCFRLFAHLAKARGYQTSAVADGLALTTRRVRQLSAESEPRLTNALRCLADPRLRIVP